MPVLPKPQNRAAYKSLTTLSASASHRSFERYTEGLISLHLPFKQQLHPAARAQGFPVLGMQYLGASTAQIHVPAA